MTNRLNFAPSASPSWVSRRVALGLRESGIMASSQLREQPQNKNPAGSSRSFRRSIRSALRLAEVRLRIPLVLIVSAAIVGRWDWVRNHWDRLTHVARQQTSAASPVSSDTEYFCPMDPGVVSNWPGKCGICNMDLVPQEARRSRCPSRRCRGPHADLSLPRSARGNRDGAGSL